MNDFILTDWRVSGSLRGVDRGGGISDVIMDRSWTDSGGDSVCLLVGKRSAQLEVEELGSGSGGDVGGWDSWVGGLKVTGGVREGRADVFKEGRLVVLVFLASSLHGRE